MLMQLMVSILDTVMHVVSQLACVVDVVVHLVRNF